MLFDINWNPKTFIFISIGSNWEFKWHSYLHRNVIIKPSIAQNFKANGSKDYQYKLKRKQKSYKIYKKKSEIIYKIS